MNGRALLAFNLKRLRLRRGIPQEQLAADAGVDRAYVSELERRKGNATLDTLDKLAKVLGVPLAELLRAPRAGENAPKPLPVGRRPAKERAKSRV